MIACNLLLEIVGDGSVGKEFVVCLAQILICWMVVQPPTIIQRAALTQNCLAGHLIE